MGQEAHAMDQWVRKAVKKITGEAKRHFIAEITVELCDGNARMSEERFGWSRKTVKKGMKEREEGIVIADLPRKGRPTWEEANPQIAEDIRNIVETKSYVDPTFESDRVYSNLTAKEVCLALRKEKRYRKKAIPPERTMRRILNRLGYRLKKIQKGRPLKKVKETDAIFENIRDVKAEAKRDKKTLEISVDTKAKVAIGNYSRGGKNTDCRKR
jgi:transposase